MLTINKLLARGEGLAPVLLKRAAAVELDWAARRKSRFEATDTQGRTLGVVLPPGSVLRGGDVLVAADGSLIRVIAAAQPVLVVRPCAEHGSPFDLVRAAYHLGKRHVPLELQSGCLQLEPDALLAAMLRAMHLLVGEAVAAFEPEGEAWGEHGAHDGPHGHRHDHGQPADGHDHGPAHAPAPRGRPIGVAVSAAPAPHVHGPGCGHDHDHHH